MNKTLLAGMAAVGLLAGGGSATALTAAGLPAAAASTVAVASSTSKAPADCGPLEPLVAKGTITHAQAVAIHNAFINYVRDHWRSTVDTVLGQQVKHHIITRTQANAVTSAITQWVHMHQSEEKSHHEPCQHGDMTRGSGSR